MGRIGIKGIVLLISVIFGIWNINSKYSKYRNEVENNRILKENRGNLEDKISTLISEREKQKKKLRSDYEQIQILTRKISLMSIKNESEFKKMIYVLSNESGLKMKEVSKSEKLWERSGYSLKYIHFTLYGSLNSFGKFLYFVNKSRKFIDTSKMYVELSREGFKISLGFIERNQIIIDGNKI